MTTNLVAMHITTQTVQTWGYRCYLARSAYERTKKSETDKQADRMEDRRIYVVRQRGPVAVKYLVDSGGSRGGSGGSLEPTPQPRF